MNFVTTSCNQTLWVRERAIRYDTARGCSSRISGCALAVIHPFVNSWKGRPSASYAASVRSVRTLAVIHPFVNNWSEADGRPSASLQTIAEPTYFV